jgi:CIC family chloride channel protein
MIVSVISITVAHYIEPLSLEGKKLSALLRVSVDDRDKYLLSKLDLLELIEKNFSAVRSDYTLEQLVQSIASSTRNIFPVLKENGELEGIIHLDDVRSVIFQTDLYKTLTVKNLMKLPAAVIHSQEHLHDILKKFDETREWSLPVTENKKYIGFVSKSSILTRYRTEILKSV